DKRGKSKAGRNCNELRPQGIARLDSKTREIRVINDESCKVGNGRHDTVDKSPSKFAAMDGMALLNNRAEATRFLNGPPKECEASNRDDIGLDGEEMADLMNREPDCG